MKTKNNPLIALLIALVCLFAANPAFAGRRPATQQEACVMQCRIYEDFCHQSACEATCNSVSGIEFRAVSSERQRRVSQNGYSYYEDYCPTGAVPVVQPTAAPVATGTQAPAYVPPPPPPNLPPQWLQAAVNLDDGTRAFEQMAADTHALRLLMEERVVELSAQIDRLQVAQRTQASASRSSGSSSTARPVPATTASTSRRSLEDGWAACQRLKPELESNPLYLPVFLKCGWVGSQLGVN